MHEGIKSFALTVVVHANLYTSCELGTLRLGVSMRPIWKGSLNFGLIHIPINLYSGTETHHLEFEMLHEKDLSPIRYAKICRKENKEVPWEEIVKGYEYQEEDYVVLTEEDFKDAAVENDKSIEIIDFVKEEEIDSVYFEKPYFLEPGKGAGKPYILLREALHKSKKVGVAKFVLRQKEILGVLKPYRDLLVLDQIRYHEDIRNFEDLTIPKKSVTKKEMDMALQLIDQMTSIFNPKAYHDTYKENLQKMIKSKARGKKIHVKKPEKKEEGKVIDLMTELKKSLQEGKKKKRRKAG